MITQTFLKSPQGSQIFIRKKSGLQKKEEKISTRQVQYDYERRYEIED